MATKGEAFAGLSVAITTPLRDGEVDYVALKSQVEFQIDAGTQCLCPVGTTGESPTLSHDEHERVISAVVETARGRIKVMPGTGSNSTSEALRLTRWAAKAGADAALVVAPYYNKPTQEGFYQHFRALAEAVDIPICIYNIPGRTGKNIEPETIARLAELKNITMVKEATGSMDQASQTIALTDLTILSGDDSVTLPLLALGGRGVISVVGNIVPRDMLAMLQAHERGDMAAARAAHYKLFPLCRDMLGLSTNPIPIKAAMKMLGRDTGELRLPMTVLEEPLERKLRQTLVQYGLLQGDRAPRAFGLSFPMPAPAMRRVLLLFEYPTLNGGELSMLALLAQLAERGYEAVALAPAEGRLANELGDRGIEHIAWQLHDEFGRRIALEQVRARIADQIAQVRPAIVHANSLSMARVLGAVDVGPGILRVGHMRDIVTLSRQAIADLNGLDALFAVSHATRDFHVAQGVSAECVTVIYNGVDTRRFAPVPQTGWLHRELGIAPDSPLVGNIGQLVRRKGQDVLLAAAQIIAGQRADVHFLLIGERYSRKQEALDYEAELQRLAESEQLAGRVHFCGYLGEIDRVLPEHSIVAHAARQEPLGRVLLEASAAGRPIVATDVGGTREVLGDDGETARLVAADDPLAMARSIGELLASDEHRERLGCAARQRALRLFDRDLAAAALADEYERLLGR